MTSSPISVVSPMTTPIPWSMKNRRPIVAPGWISTPVTDLTIWDSSRAARRVEGLPHNECATR